MKKLSFVACFTLVALLAVTPTAHAAGRVIISFGFGGGYYGAGYYGYYGGGYGPNSYYGYGPAYGPYDPYYVYRYPYAIPYARPFVTYGYVPPVRFYPGPAAHGYAPYPGYRHYPGPQRVFRGGYGSYTPRVYVRHR
jgi:hypothetical protein